MRTMMMTLAILMFSACGVDQPKTTHQNLGGQTLEGSTGPATRGGSDADTEEPQPCELTTDCEVGVCDRATKTCVGDEPVQGKPHVD